MSVLVVVQTADDARPLVRWGARFARAKATRLVVLYPTRGARDEEPTDVPLRAPDDDHEVRSAVRAAIAELGELFSEGGETPAERGEKDGEPPGGGEPEGATGAEPEAPPVPVTFRTVVHTSRARAILAELSVLGTDLVVVAKQRKAQGSEEEQQRAELGLQLFDQVTCDLILLRAFGDSGRRCDRVVVPAAGGPHALVALGLARRMVESDGGEVVPLYVATSGSEDAIDIGAHELRKTMARAGLVAGERIRPRVVAAADPGAGIAHCVGEQTQDLVLVGASNRGRIRQVLFGTIPDKLVTGPEVGAIAVVREATPVLARIEAAIAGLVPQIEREQRRELFADLELSSRFNFDFGALIALSTGIAALGLIQSSPAVVIGAMLVAPLMIPMIGAGLGLVQDNLVLTRTSMLSIFLGFTLALAIGYTAGLASLLVLPPGELTSELIARGNPTVLDLIVAFLSGLAAAYARARPGLLSALPGVAIAAALVPPIATVGISFARGAYGNGVGAAMLFATNLVTIILSSAVAFRLMGVHGPRKKKRRRVWVDRVALLLLISMIALGVPLVAAVVRRVGGAEHEEPLRLTRELRHAIEARIIAEPDTTLLGIERGAAGGVAVTIACPDAPAPTLALELSRLASEALHEPVAVHLVALRQAWSQTAEPEPGGD